MTENQKLKMELLKEFAISDEPKSIEVCRQMYKFMVEDEGQTPASKSYTKQLKDGVYYVTTDGMIIPYRAVLTPPEDLKGVGVVMGERSIIVALTESTAGEETTLATRKDTADLKGSYIEWCIDAVADWNGRENTEHLKAVGLNPAIRLRDDEYIPSMGEMYLIYMNRRTINVALEKANGQPLTNDWYWTSTEFSAASAWRLYLGSGLMANGTKASYTYRVRPVSAFLSLIN